jgi:2-polyprenyl-3-methyl-5-hydroxy-6-metoxy-1,4-benzoquinol methylase
VTETVERTVDADFAKYAESGAYHWEAIGGHWIRHHAFTAERYRRTLAAAGPLVGKSVLDFGCGDGALLGWISRAVGPTGKAVGFEPNELGRRFAAQELAKRRLAAEVVGDSKSLSDASFDAIVCAEVIEHVPNPATLLAEFARLLKPGGCAVVTTPIRMTETPEDPNHFQEWFFAEFAEFLRRGPLELRTHEAAIPLGAVEAYYWRPRFFLRVPIFRLLCNWASIYFGVNSLTWLRVRPRLFMLQIAALHKS